MSKELAVNQILFRGLMSEEPFKLDQTPFSIHGADKDSQFPACGIFGVIVVPWSDVEYHKVSN